MAGGNGGSGGVVSLTIPAKPEYIALGRLALTGLLRPHEIAEEVVADLKLALTEACSNSIRHAYADEREGVVQIRYELENGRVAVEVVDDGHGFDSEEVEPLDSLGSLDEGGLGLAIIRAVTDELAIGRRDDGAGSRLRFAKYFA
jgi:serine/threonine-protein kinase RsbW